MIRHPFWICVLMLPALVAPSAAEKRKPFPKDLPPYGPLEPFKAPQVTTRTLSNGLTLWLVPRPGFPKVSFAVAVRGGLASDPKERPGLSQLITDAVDQGTKTRTASPAATPVSHPARGPRRGIRLGRPPEAPPRCRRAGAGLTGRPGPPGGPPRRARGSPPAGPAGRAPRTSACSTSPPWWAG